MFQLFVFVPVLLYLFFGENKNGNAVNAHTLPSSLSRVAKGLHCGHCIINKMYFCEHMTTQ